MYKTYIKRCISSILIFCMLSGTGLTQAITQDNNLNIEENDPFAYMIDEPTPETPKVEEQDLNNDKATNDKNKIEKNNTILENQKETKKVSTPPDRSVTDRYIVKYKTEKKDSFNDKIKDKLKNNFTIKATCKNNKDNYDNIKLITLNKKIKPSEFAKELKQLNAGQDIEFIQPDYELSLQADSANTDTSKTTEDKEQPETGNEEQPKTEDKEQPETGNEEQPKTEDKEQPETGNEEQPKTEDKEQPETGNEEQPKTEDKEQPKTEDKEQPKTEDKEQLDDELNEQGLPVIVAVIDTGMDIDHSNFDGFVWKNNDEIENDNEDNDANGFVDDINGWNFTANNANIYSKDNPLEYAHGTHVAGTIVSKAKEKGISVKIMPLKVFSNGAAYTSDIINAITYAKENGATIINCSFGSSMNNPALEQAIKETNALFVCAVGNSRTNISEKPIYPASYRFNNVINVASVNADDGFSYYSNYSNTMVDVAAVGRDVISALPENESGNMSGTSMAAAMVSGCAAVVKCLNLDMDINGLKNRIINTSDKLSNLQDKIILGKRINLENAINNTCSQQVITVNPADDYDVNGYAPTPEEEFELFSSLKATAVAAGADFSLALMENGTVWSWGNNTLGQLGDGTNTNSLKPVQVIGLNNITNIVAGAYHCLARKSDGTVWSWGYNAYGQLGLGNTQNYNIPVQVTASRITEIVAGMNHSMIRDSIHGSVSACGDNSFGQLGNQNYTNTYSTTLIRPDNMIFVSKIATGGNHSLAYKGGSVWAWGCNSNGQLGNGSYTNSNTPVSIATIDNVTSLAAGSTHSMVLCSDNTIKTWGDNTSYQLGNRNLIYQTPSWSWYAESNRTQPGNCDCTGIKITSGATASHSLAINVDGAVMGWGNNSHGQLGVRPYLGLFTNPNDGSSGAWLEAEIPMEIMREATDISVGGTHSLILKNDGTIWALGNNSSGQLGNGSLTNTDIPVSVGINYHCESFEMAKIIGISNRYVGSIDEKYTDDYIKFKITTPGTYIINVNGASISAILYDASRTEIVKMASNKQGRITKELNASDYYLKLSSNYIGRYAVSVNQLMNEARIQKISLGAKHTLAIKDDGTLRSWGDNIRGQLGDGTTTGSMVPRQVDGLYNIVSIAAGNYHSIATRGDGTVWAWGYNYDGQLGDGTNTTRYTPVQVRGLIGVTQVATGWNHNLALKKDGTVWSWGNNTYGQLGDGSTTNRNMPIQVIGLTDVVSISTGSSHSMALKSDGTVWIWGYNAYGQVGDGTTTNSNLPRKVESLSGITDISAGGYHCLARKSDGTVWSWGYNYYGQLGDNSTTNRSTPVQVSNLTGADTIYSGGNHSIVNKIDGTVWSWGGNSYGQLGNNQTSSTCIPQLISGLSNITQLIAVQDSNIAIKGDGTIYAWGFNNRGQLGDGTTTNRIVPTQIINWFPADLLANPIDIGTNTEYTGSLKEDSLNTCIKFTISQSNTYNIKLTSNGITATLCNSNKEQLGTAFYEANKELSPGDYYLIIKGQAAGDYTLKISTSQKEYNVKSFGSGNGHTLILMSNGTVWGTGANNYFQLDASQINRNTPIWVYSNTKQVCAESGVSMILTNDGKVYQWGELSSFYEVIQVNGLVDIIAISRRLALKNDGTVWAWNYNGSQATQITGLTNIIAISAGNSHNIALKKDGTIWAWGSNEFGQLGDGTTTNKTTPVQVSGLTDIISISSTGNHNLALKKDGTVWSWGANSDGQLGDGTTTNRITPLQIAGLTNVISISAGSFHSIALKNDGTVWTWGKNSSGQLGDSTTTNKSTPTQVNIGESINMISAGYDTSFAVGTSVYAWGENSNGQLGNGTNTNALVPFKLDAWCYPNAFSTAKNIDINAKYTEQVSKANLSLFYKFIVTTAGQYHVKISGIEASVSIINDSWNIFASGDGTATLQPGTYYALVNPSIGSFEISVMQGSAQSTETKLNTIQGKVYDVVFKLCMVNNFATMEYTLKYPAEMFDVVTLCSKSSTPITSVTSVPYTIPNTDIIITQFGNGIIKFKTTRTGSSRLWVVVNTIKLKAKNTGLAIIEPSVNG